MEKKLILALLILSSCAYPEKKFDKEVNCSADARDYLYAESAKLNNKMTKETKEEVHARLQEIFNADIPNIKSCYDKFVLHKGYRDSYNVCTIIKFNEKGKVNYLFLDDATQGMDEKFRDCLKKEISAIDFSVTGAMDMVHLQPLNFHSIR
jgi:hypothetical protein